MGDPEFVEGKVREMLDEARGLLFEGRFAGRVYPNPQAGVEPLIEKWAKEFSPANRAYIQTMGEAALDIWLKSRGFGTDDNRVGDPIRALLATIIGQFVEVSKQYHEGRATDEQLAFAIDAAVEDCVALLRGLDNPAD